MCAMVDGGVNVGGKARWEEWVGCSISPFGRVIVGPVEFGCLLRQYVEGLK